MSVRNPSVMSLVVPLMISTIATLVVIQMIIVLTSPTLVVAQTTLRISSSAISDAGKIPTQFTCSGDNQSPPLAWTGVPQGTRSLALVVEDPDAPSGSFIHWIVYDISPSLSGFRQGMHAGKDGVNSLGKAAYMGPCPPPGNPHHYHFQLYALDVEPKLGDRPDADTMRHMMNGHIIQSADLVGIFSR